MLLRDPIPILKCGADGHHFVVYGDSCSGISGALHEGTFTQVNKTIRALETPPAFICFLGDEIMGLTVDAQALRRQWRYFFGQELSWLDREAIPLYHTTGNHTVYDSVSESVYLEVMAHLPQNGPADQHGLSYFVRRGDLLMIFVNTLWSGSSGEGTLETEWLNKTLTQHEDARHKLVFGHHPLWAVNGYFGDYQRPIERENGLRFWDVLQRHEVLAYFCSHILAFDVQVQGGVLQICTAGAGAAHRMPPEHEYLHIVQAALDADGFRYQTLDRQGKLREWLCWKWQLPPSSGWATFEPTSALSLAKDCLQLARTAILIAWEITACLSPEAGHQPQTILCAHAESGALPYLWLGISGVEQQLTVLLSPEANRSPHRWQGPVLPVDRPFSIQFAIHSGMGPSGLLWRWNEDDPWSSMIRASPWGVERLPWPCEWRIGESAGQQKFRGQDLRLKWHHETFSLSDFS